MLEQAAFPQETFDAIIDYLHHDVRTLKQCSLACHIWLPSSSLHLFSSLSWPPRRVDLSELRLGPEEPYDETLARLLLSSNRLRVYIRKLTLGCWFEELENASDVETINLNALMRIVDALPSLDSLHLASYIVLGDTYTVELRHSRTLLELNYTISAATSPPEATYKFFAAFRRISSLAIMNTNWGHAGSWRKPSFPVVDALIQIEKLQLSTASDDVVPCVLRDLASIFDLPRLHSLSIEGDIEIFLGSSLALAPNIRDLAYSAHPESSPFDLQNLCLHSVRIQSSLGPRFAWLPSSASGWHAIIRDLQLLRTSALERIVITICTPSLVIRPPDRPYAALFFEHILPSWQSLSRVLESCPVLYLFRIEICPRPPRPPEEDKRIWLNYFNAALSEHLPDQTVEDKVQVVIRDDNSQA
ncbi:hypothetical protein PHLGIDRAFT_447754 [Phlebiopsis gigantea 11061_1 CR5-6]|uniref:F-box domain-containing protein n=1 Tax=Phlebiopsis gigantea (strain 11061_1 CR5-6) TaxID=745531 RepID=A0A0C3RXS2_PHLG1|nr:hypothetical protein PHLGIDRAFT_447754 [Phlebiopsis gigantea 11061_1 CR5-6]